MAEETKVRELKPMAPVLALPHGGRVRLTFSGETTQGEVGDLLALLLRNGIMAVASSPALLVDRELEAAVSAEMLLLDADARAELELLRDVARRMINFDGGAEVLPWEAAHRHHADEPYIGCPFCRDRFVLREEGRDGPGTADQG